MNPYLIEQVLKDRIEQLHREAEHYRLGRKVSRSKRRLSRSLFASAGGDRVLAGGRMGPRRPPVPGRSG